MSQIKIEANSSGGGIYTLQSGAGSTDRTITLPDKAGAIAVGAGTIVQTQSMLFTSSSFSTTSTTYQDVTGFSLAITPTSTSNKILIIMSATLRMTGGGSDNNGRGFIALCRGSTQITNRLQGTYGDSITDLNSYNSTTQVFMDSPATTSATTYKVKIGTYNTNWTASIINDANYTNIDSNTLTLMEVVA
jgi:hypothetical protein